VAKLRVGVVGLGGIAQKAWLPVLSAATDWTLQGAWSPSRDKALRICESIRMPYYSSLQDLARECDVVFVHTSTVTHYQVVSELLQAGVHVCVDKPLADNLADAERLIELAARKKLTLMVGFNRRFAPLAGDNVQLTGGTLQTNEQGAMVYAEHHFSAGNLQITTSMHRRAGSQREWIQAVTDGALLDITDMREWREERGAGVVTPAIPGWQSTLEQRGFAGCARHFIECVQNQTVPETAGEQAIRAQRIVEKLWRDAMSE